MKTGQKKKTKKKKQQQQKVLFSRSASRAVKSGYVGLQQTDVLFMNGLIRTFYSLFFND